MYNAMDKENLQSGGNSAFIEQVFDPAKGASSKPDHVLRRHTLKSVTISESINTSGTNGSGLLVLYPNNASTRIGAIYAHMPDGSMKFQRVVKGPQTLVHDFDFIRNTGRVVTVGSSTIPSGAYAISGTFNATTYNGNLSDIGFRQDEYMPDINSYSYGNILGCTGDAYDQQAAVPVLTGLTALSYPPVDEPFTRLNDTLGHKTYTAWNSVDAKLYDSSDDYTTILTSEVKTPIAIQMDGPDAAFVDIGAQFDTFTTAMGTYTHEIYLDPPTGGNWLSNGQMSMASFTQIKLLGLSGEEVTAKQVIDKQTTTLIKLDANERLAFNVAGSFAFSSDEITQPVVAVKVFVSLAHYGTSFDGAQLNFTNYIGTGSNMHFKISAGGSGRQGNNNPLNLIAWNGLTPDGVITLDAKCNYEAVPNSNLIKQVETHYPSSNSGSVELYKSLLHHRRELGIHSIMKPLDYERLKLTAIAFYSGRNLPNQLSEPQSAGFWNILKKIKNVAVPALSVMFPEFAPVTQAAGAVFDGVVNKIDPQSSGLDYTPMSSGILNPVNTRLNKLTDPERTMVNLNLEGATGALLPVVYRTSKDNKIPGMHLALVIKTVRDPALTEEVLGRMGCYQSGGKGKVYNAVSPLVTGMPFFMSLDNDIVILPVERLRDNMLTTTFKINSVSGESHMLAAKIADLRSRDLITGISNFAFTGGLVEEMITPISYVYHKKVFCNKEGLFLTGGTPGVDYQFNTLTEAYNFSKADYGFTTGSVLNGTPLGDDILNDPLSASNFSDLVNQSMVRAAPQKTFTLGPTIRTSLDQFNNVYSSDPGVTQEMSDYMSVATKILVEYPDVTKAIAELFRIRTPQSFERMIVALYKESEKVKAKDRRLESYESLPAKRQMAVLNMMNMMKKLDPNFRDVSNPQLVVDYINSERSGRFLSPQDIVQMRQMGATPQSKLGQNMKIDLQRMGVAPDALTDDVIQGIIKEAGYKGLSVDLKNQVAQRLGAIKPGKKDKQEQWVAQLRATINADRYMKIPANIREGLYNQAVNYANEVLGPMLGQKDKGPEINKARAAISNAMTKALREQKVIYSNNSAQVLPISEADELNFEVQPPVPAARRTAPSGGNPKPDYTGLFG